MIRKLALATLAGLLVLGISACEREGTGERVGEEVDEAADTMKHGEESVGTKVDDAVDQAREEARDVGDAATKD